MRHSHFLPALCFAVIGSSSMAMEAAVAVPGCPSSFAFQLSGIWSDARQTPEIIETLSGNSARQAEYTAAWMVEQDRSDPAWVAIGTLGSLKSAQGRITFEQFEELRSVVLSQVDDMSPEFREAVRERADALAGGALVPFDQPEYKLFGSLHGEADFAILGVVVILCFAFIDKHLVMSLLSVRVIAVP